MKVKATALNRADLLQKRGKYNPPEGASKILGLESVGVLVDPLSLKPISPKLYGALLPGGGYADYVVVNKSHLLEIPESFSLEQAAAIPEAWLTALLILGLAEVKKDDFVYISAGASGISTAAIQLATKLFCAKPIVTCSSEEKVEYCLKLGAHGGIHYRKQKYPDLIKYLLEATDLKGFNSALDCVGPAQTSIISQILA